MCWEWHLLRIEELGGFIPDVTEAVLPGMIFQPLLVARPLGRLSTWRSASLGIQSGHVLALGLGTSHLNPLEIHFQTFRLGQVSLPCCSIHPACPQLHTPHLYLSTYHHSNDVLWMLWRRAEGDVCPIHWTESCLTGCSSSLYSYPPTPSSVMAGRCTQYAFSRGQWNVM